MLITRAAPQADLEAPSRLLQSLPEVSRLSLLFPLHQRIEARARFRICGKLALQKAAVAP